MTKPPYQKEATLRNNYPAHHPQIDTDGFVMYEPQVLTPAQQGQARANIGADLLTGFRNAIINGGFDVWQRGTSFGPDTGVGYTADRWYRHSSGGTHSVSRQTFTIGQTDVPGNPKYFLRYSATVGNDFMGLYHRIEDVTTFSGETVTLTFWAKGTNPGGGSIRSSLFQLFGTGGSPSSTVSSIGSVQFSVTSSWQKFTRTIDIPSVSGKTLGTNNNDYLGMVFDQGSDTSTDSWELDLAHVSLVLGDATQEDDPYERRPITIEENLCFRYYWEKPVRTWLNTIRSADAGPQYRRAQLSFPTRMRISPTVTWTANVEGGSTVSTATTQWLSVDGCDLAVEVDVAAAYVSASDIIVDAEF